MTIRPPDPVIVGPTMAYMNIPSHEAVRRLVHLAFRDAATALDLTYARGSFWRDPRPPDLVLTSNNLDPASSADLHLDFRGTGLPDRCFGLTVYDPPHLADGGTTSIMAARYGTVRGIAGLHELIVTGAQEAFRLASVGVLVKVADHAHQGELLQLSRWIENAMPVPPYTILHTFRSSYLRDGKHRVERVPRSNGAVWMTFRRDGHRHRDFDRLYARQEARARKGVAA